jgi:serine/threonine protein kinase
MNGGSAIECGRVVTNRAGPGVGETFGGYTIESLLGRGGMGTVYLATHERLARKVALKVISPELAHDADFRARFLRESQLAASLDHPNVIPIYDADEIDGILFLAMRYVDGPSLQALLRARGSRARSP